MVLSSLSLAGKQQKLQDAAQQLKQEFVGLDDIIDQVVRLVTPWYLFPEWQQRPTIINLWGMTGVGKTSLVKRLVQLLALDERFYLFDMGNNSERVDTLRTFFKTLCKDGTSFPLVLGLDEFQYANTKSGRGEELEKAYSRVVWDLLDTGRFQVFRDGFSQGDIADVLAEMKFLLSKGVKVERGYVVEGVEYYLKVSGTERVRRGQVPDEEIEVELPDENGVLQKRRFSKKLLFVKEDVIQQVYDLCSDWFRHRIEIKDHLLQLDGPGTVSFLEKVVVHTQSRREINCTQALVFVMGNLDEAYQFSHIVNPDLSADEFCKRSRAITINNIKCALQKRFRHEQIGRLGNNHIIYPTLDCRGFEGIIARELDALSRQAREHMGVALCFGRAVHQLVYKEGVFPTQGTRPLFSTLQQLLAPCMALLPGMVARLQGQCVRVQVDFKKKILLFRFYDIAGHLLHTEKETPALQLGRLRSSRRDELQAVTAVHESGHALVSALLMGVVPTQIFSVSSDSGAAGLVVTESRERTVWSRQSILQRAAVCLGGLIAEKLVFGEEHLTAGSESDIRAATALVSNLVRRQGLAGSTLWVEVEEMLAGQAVYDRDGAFNQQVNELVGAAGGLAGEVLKEHHILLLKLSQYLARHAYMSKRQFVQFLKSYAGGASHLPGKFSYRKTLFQAAQGKGDTRRAASPVSFVCLNKSSRTKQPE